MSLNNRISISDLAAMKKRGEKWAMLTSYEQMTAEIFDEAQSKSHRCSSSRDSVSDDDARHEDTLDSGRRQGTC